MLHLLVDWEYPHWMMMAGAILVALGFMGFAFHQNRNGPGTGIHHPNRTAKGYAGIRIRIGCRPAEGEGEIVVESRSSRWTPQEDALLRRMAEASARPEIIAIKLNRTVHAVKARAYMIGLPLKWFKLKAKGK